ncbi:unnamed protein product [Parajaminaea phylloscopi]
MSVSDLAVTPVDEKQIMPDADTSGHSHKSPVEPASNLSSSSMTTASSNPPSRLERIMGPTLSRYYAKTYTQVFIIGLTAFCCPGMFNALSGMGGGGQVDPRPADRANIALYSTFAAVSFFAGSIHNKLGTRLTLWLGSLGYTVYIAAFLSYNFNRNQGFIVFSGALLGVCASLFWSAQGAAMLCYPTEAQKGRFIAIFWTIFNLGAVIGSAVAMGLSWHSADGASSLGNGTYAAFIAITFLGGLIAALLKDPATLVRSDGTTVVVPKSTTWRFELLGLGRLLRTDPWVLLLFPMFFASNFFYTWQNQVYNAKLFTLRTRALNSLLYWLAQIFGALLVSIVLDNPRVRRRTRAWAGWGITFVIVWAVWAGCYVEQKKFSRESLPERIDLTDSSQFVGPCLLYLFSGGLDAVWQVFTYWLIGCVSNDLAKLAILAGFLKSLQSAGAASAFGLDYDHHPYMTILAVTWGLCVGGLLLALPILAQRIHDHTDPLGEKTAPGREYEVQRGMEDGIKRTGKIPEPLKNSAHIDEKVDLDVVTSS